LTGEVKRRMIGVRGREWRLLLILCFPSSLPAVDIRSNIKERGLRPCHGSSSSSKLRCRLVGPSVPRDTKERSSPADVSRINELQKLLWWWQLMLKRGGRRTGRRQRTSN
jgi:hypothetical protein